MRDNGSLDCEFERNAAGCLQCTQCGWVYQRRGVCREPQGRLVRQCPAKNPAEAAKSEPWGLGDHASMILEAAGITDLRVTIFLRAVRLLDKEGACGCDERRQWLNALGWRLVAWAKRKGLLK